MSLAADDGSLDENTPGPDQTVLFRKHLSGYVAVGRTVAEDSRLSFRARGVLLYLLAKPDGWAFRAETIARDGSEGREAIRSALRELRVAGYYRVGRDRYQGRFVMRTEVSDVSRPDWIRESRSTGDGFLDSGEPDSGRPEAGKAPPKQETQQLFSEELAPTPPEPPPQRPRQRPPDLLWEAVLAACEIPLDQPLTESARGAYNRAVRDLRSIGATPEQVAAKADGYREKWPRTTLTPTALARHWAEIEEPLRPRDRWRDG